ncbi:MAG: GNAT family N-acetyltransferase [Sulfitobacter sp.]
MSFGPAEHNITSLLYPKDYFAELMHRLEELHSRPHGAIMVAEKDGVIFGSCMSQRIRPGVTEIKRLFIEPEHRGSGAGRALVQALVDLSREDGDQFVYLDTSKSFGPARHLYESMGFKSRGPYSEILPAALEVFCFYELALKPAA